MWTRFHERPFRGWRPGIRTEADPWLLQLPANILLRHHEIYGVDTTVVLDYQVNRGFSRIRAAFVGDFLQCLPGQRPQLLVLESDQQDFFRGAERQRGKPRVQRVEVKG